MNIELALFEPDIPQNTGSIMRLAACLGIKLNIIEPCGFLLNDKQLKRVMMDYGSQVELQRHVSWNKYIESKPDNKRLILLSTKAEIFYTDFRFQPGDVLLLGRESSGVPDYVVEASQARVKIPMRGNARSLNVALAAGMALGEALRQTGGFMDSVEGVGSD